MVSPHAGSAGFSATANPEKESTIAKTSKRDRVRFIEILLLK
jgi:hypothetical protein